MDTFAGSLSHRWGRLPARAGLLALVMLLAIGCAGHAKVLREAQDQFNAAATLENQVKLDPLAGDTLVTVSRAQEGYRQALALVSPLIEEKHNALAQDNLLGSAYTLKALALWRLGNYDQTLATLQAAGSPAVADSLYPRDRAIMTAMRGLIKNDQASLKMQRRGPAGEPVATYHEITTLLTEAMADLNSGVAEVEAAHAIRYYLAVSQLAVMKNWSELFNAPSKYATAIPDDFSKQQAREQWCAACRPAWQRFTAASEHLDPRTAEAMQQWWGDRLGMPQACP